jgi:hypothetical protein
MFEEIRKSIETRFAAQWPGLTTNTPFVFENAPVKNPQPKTFVRATIHLGSPVNFTIGRIRSPRHPGQLTLQIFTPKNVGNAASRKLADAGKGIFEFQQFVEGTVQIHFYAPGELLTTGERTDYFQENLILRFEACQTVNAG